MKQFIIKIANSPHLTDEQLYKEMLRIEMEINTENVIRVHIEEEDAPWIETTPIAIPDDGQEVLGYNKAWVDEDYNPDGICVCFINDEKLWTISMWCGVHDEWHTWEHNVPHPDRSGVKPAPTHWKPKPQPPIN